MLPCEFLERMKNILGGELDAFAKALSRPAVRSFRINGVKASEGEVYLPCGVRYEKIPYAKDGYTITEGGEGLGNSPSHHCGAIYFQDAGAMGPVNALPPLPPHARVLDLCASPGGKSGQLSALIGEGGSLLSNEVVPKRTRVLVSNMERLGVKNACVTSLEVSRIAELYPEYFDAVVIDAPCSGEGMFRKGDEALLMWSVENILASAKRQREILNEGSKTVAEGGYLLYSTCTYAPEENELQVVEFLKAHTDFALVECKNPALVEATADGIRIKGADLDTSLCRRSYPHRSDGEGQFFALMQRKSGEGRRGVTCRDASAAPTRDEERLVLSFLRDNLVKIPNGRLVRQQSTISLVSHEIPLPERGVFMPGVALGEVIKGRLVPHHQLFSAYGHLFRNRYELRDENEAARYMHGEEIAAPPELHGYVAITWHGCAIGGGKASSGVIKNHYPKGLRI